jgi:hypothetical protein
VPDRKLLADMGKLNQRLVAEGVMLGGEGLQPSSRGTRVRLSGKELTVIDWPFAEAKELIAGFWLVQTASLEQAVEWAKRVPTRAEPEGEGEIEIRRLFEVSDFPADPAEQPEGWREQEQRLRDEAQPAGSAAPGPAAPPRKASTIRFMVMLKSDPRTESEALPSPQALTQMGALTEELAASGGLLAGEGLRPSRHGARVRLSGKKRTVIDGPFAESKEMIAGYLIIQVESKQEAVELARRWLQIHVETSDVDGGEIEIRPLLELSDLPAAAEA